MKIALLLVVFISTCAFAQGSYSDSLKLSITEKNIRLNKGRKKIRIPLKLINLSTKTYLLYNFGNGEEATLDDTLYCGRTTARLSLAILDSMHQNILPIVQLPGYGPRSKIIGVSDLNRMFKSMEKSFMKNKLILKPGETYIDTLTFKVFNKLSQGNYFVFIFYSIGDYLDKIISKETIDDDLIQNNATLINVCFKSDLALLKIK
ncbi:hypothetical protein GXP67_28205 [Rhodocytophaga rosea]|uniref:Uncharacterized protein n=1 Tax=Rhodocytophaga rosea TaxID=2704465 RepID=A0A6C0GQA6_9BACT|nr:hypothetical protein [Rhodocytophaga rosea]QHT70256.1 hypothetical protein GXP67_28205 [Rhodocytophaga rosea]